MSNPTRKKIIKLFILIIGTLFVSYFSSSSKPVDNPSQIKQNTSDSTIVKRVIDGDTFETLDGSKVRLIGIDSPENPAGKNPDCFAYESYVFLKELIEDKVVVMTKDVSDKDKYERLLRYVYLDNVFINEKMVKEGFAKAIPYPPDTLFQGDLTAAQKEARGSKTGLWGCK